MAEFLIREIEGMRQVQLDIQDETVRARYGALSNMRGNIAMTPRLPNVEDGVRAFFNNKFKHSSVLQWNWLNSSTTVA